MRIKSIDVSAWYDVPGYDGKYQVNFDGNVRMALKHGRYKVLRPYVKKSTGRRCIKLNGKEQVVMKIMQRTFIGEIPPGMSAYHKNGLKSDDCLGNIGVLSKSELAKLTGLKNGCEFRIVKINDMGEIVDVYRSAREAGRKNYMSYQAILDRINGRVKSLYAPDGYVYVKDKDRDIQEAIRKIELDSIKKAGIGLQKAIHVQFDF